jgi:hypothetical protein
VADRFDHLYDWFMPLAAIFGRNIRLIRRVTDDLSDLSRGRPMLPSW